MPDREKQILSSVDEALNEVDQIFDQRQNDGLPHEGYVPLRFLKSFESCHALAGMDDFEDVQYIPTPKMRYPGEVLVDSCAELMIVYEMFRKIMGAPHNPASTAVIQGGVTHEAEHAEAYQAPSIDVADNLYYGMHFHRKGNAYSVRSAFVSLAAQSRPISKLALASAALHPQVPSKTDITNLENMGYADIGDLEAKIVAYNLQHATNPLPIRSTPYAQRATS